MNTLMRLLAVPYRFWLWTRTVNSAIFFGAYLLAIPLFAGLFTYMRGGFYHTTAKYETNTFVQAHRVISILTNTVRANVNAERVAEAGFTIGRLQVRGIEPNDGSVLFSILVDTTNRDGVQSVMSLDAEMDSHPLLIRFDPNGPVAISVLRFRGPKIRYKLPDRFRPEVSTLFGANESDTCQAIQVEMPADEYAQIRAFLLATQGHPQYIPGTFGRMLYVSACTITTLGYGDIVPTSAITRTLVGTEAVLGIVLMGLFFGSTTYDGDQVRDPREESKSGRFT